jgi:hypothetical protein
MSSESAVDYYPPCYMDYVRWVWCRHVLVHVVCTMSSCAGTRRPPYLISSCAGTRRLPYLISSCAGTRRLHYLRPYNWLSRDGLFVTALLYSIGCAFAFTVISVLIEINSEQLVTYEIDAQYQLINLTIESCTSYRLTWFENISYKI